jgi:lysine-ketoglutarate reductase/saccharopine dehydrogenase-like protein (TIGR00300 family)
MHSETLHAEGHLIDSGRLGYILNRIPEMGGDYQIVDFRIGRHTDEPSRLEINVLAKTRELLDKIVQDLMTRGCTKPEVSECVLKPAEKDGVVPDDFYSTTNHRTEIFVDGGWHTAKHQRMDAAIRYRDGEAECVILRNVRAGDPIVCGSRGIRVAPVEGRIQNQLFEFMGSEISSERQVGRQVRQMAGYLKEAKERGGKIACVAGPVVVHTGAGIHLSNIVRKGYVDVILSGNALAVHDIEQALYGTSLGVDLKTGQVTEGGHKNHVRAISAIRKAGSIQAAVDTGVLRSGIMYTCVVTGTPFVLAGSIRDDGPLPDTEMDLIKAQEKYAKALEGVEVCLMLSSMLHSIGVGNMLPSNVVTICVDINPAVMTKLVDRGSSQTYGLITDVGLFLDLLDQALR